MELPKNTLCKAERLHSKTTIDLLFSGTAKSFSVYPIRVVFLPIEQEEAEASILISVSKKRFKLAVKRNRVKRQIREAYRKNKHELIKMLQEKGIHIAIAFLYLDKELTDSYILENKMKELLVRIADTLK